MRHLVIIGGHPGAGKTTISKMLEERGFIRLGIDDFYQKTPRDPGIPNWFDDQAFLDAAYASFKAAILEAVGRGERVVLETTGVGNRWKALAAELSAVFAEQLVTIYLRTSHGESMKRVSARNATEYPIKMSEEQIAKFFDLGKDAANAYRCVIDADAPLERVYAAVQQAADGVGA